MDLSTSLAAGPGKLTVLSEDGERVLCRGWRDDGDGERTALLTVLSASDQPTPDFINRLTNEYGLKDELNGLWAARPLTLMREHGRTVLLLDDPGGEPLDQLLGQPMEMGTFLRVATGLSAALRRLHERGLIHKDIKPANVLVDSATGQVWLTGFGIASRLPRERQSLEPPELVAGTLAYMAPEQTDAGCWVSAKPSCNAGATVFSRRWTRMGRSLLISSLNWNSSSARSHQFQIFHHRKLGIGSSWSSAASSTYSHGRNTRLHCSLTIYNGSTRRRSIFSSIWSHPRKSSIYCWSAPSETTRSVPLTRFGGRWRHSAKLERGSRRSCWRLSD
jgi:serine/threonine protein kinase